MPRTARNNVPGVTYHLIWRFVDRTWFFTCDEERAFYLRVLGRALADTDWRCLAYALMSNHIHIAAVAGARGAEFWAKSAHSTFARWMNARHGRVGPVLADRAKERAVSSSHEGAVLAYIHNNPVRAGVVAVARESTWTSHRAYAGLERAPGWLHVSEGLLRAGFFDPGHFDQWVSRTPGEAGSCDLAQVRRELRARGTLQVATPSATRVPIVRRPFAHVRLDPRVVIHIVAQLIGIDVDALCSRRRMPLMVSGRRVCTHVGRVTCIAGSDMAAALGVSPAAITKLSKQDLTAEERKTYHLALEWLEIELADESQNRPSRLKEIADLRDASCSSENRP